MDAYYNEHRPSVLVKLSRRIFNPSAVNRDVEPDYTLFSVTGLKYFTDHHNLSRIAGDRREDIINTLAEHFNTPQPKLFHIVVDFITSQARRAGVILIVTLWNSACTLSRLIKYICCTLIVLLWDCFYYLAILLVVVNAMKMPILQWPGALACHVYSTFGDIEVMKVVMDMIPFFGSCVTPQQALVVVTNATAVVDLVATNTTAVMDFVVTNATIAMDT